MKKLLLVTLMLTNVLFTNGTTNQQQTSQNLLKKITKDNLSLREIPLDQYTSLKRVNSNMDKNGGEHIKYQPTINGVPIEKHIIIAHRNGDEVIYGGKVIPDFEINTSPTLTEPEANQLAIAAAVITEPVWELEIYEKLKKKIEKDPNATNKPKGELVIYDGNYSYDAAQYRLAYKFQIFSINPLSHKTIYVDAHTGIILDNIENTHNCSETCNPKQVNGPTNYNSEVNLEVCCDSDVCYLCSEKGGGITVYDAKECFCSPLNCIADENGSFTNTTANEVYSITHQYYQFLLDTFDRKSIDNEDHPLIAFVHYGKNYNNAHWWNGSGFFGDGDGVYANSYTSIEIIGHEFTHGLINHTANLNYEYESGALNESFADIFGLLLENYIKGQTDWKIGDDFMLQFSAIRNVANPNDPTLRRKYPDTYLGDNYYIGEGDNGGVHTNSSIQNYWFYLLSEGGSGVNDNGYSYNIEGIGIDKAAQIAYQNLTYLFPTAQFTDAREWAIQAAIDLFGEDSKEAEQTELAWCAVGVGDCPVFDPTCNRTTDSLALVALYNSTDGPNWTIQWDFTKPMDTWFGVTLDENGRVTCIDLDGEHDCEYNYFKPGNNLSGSIPPEIGNLCELTYLDLSDNKLNGNIPPEIEKLSKLTQLSLGDNQLDGSIPPEIGNLFNLEYLSLIRNKLSGSIPPEIGNLQNLIGLNLAVNDLTGSIPPELGNCINLENINLSYNYSLTGEIPVTLSKLSKLNELSLAFGQLTGSIPPELGNLSQLSHLNLNDNQLTGTIPASFAQLENLEELWLHNNNLSGCFAPELQVLCRIDFNFPFDPVYGHTIDKGNDFNTSWEEFCATGICIPTQCHINDWTALKALYENTDGDIWFNRDGWSTTIANQDNPPADCNLGDLYGVRLNDNGRVDCIDLDGDPNCNYMDDGGNNLNGTIPSEISLLKYLTRLGLQDNDLGGFIPPQIGELNNLANLDLVRCGLIGTIPPELGNLQNLISLSLGGNELTGNIPPELGKLINLERLTLYVNELIGSIPPELGNLINLTDLGLGSNDLTGIIPPELSKLTNLKRLSLSDNELSGTIPPELGELINLTGLELNGNQLTGNIPVEFENLVKLTIFKISNNNLSGCYEPDLKELLCVILPQSEYFDGNEDISDGNNFNAIWEDFCATDAGACNCKDRETLIEVYETLGGPASDLNWDLTLPMNEWEGVSVNEFGCVTNLNFRDKQLSGEISAAIGDLTQLESLSLRENELIGIIPLEIGNLTKLKSLYLNDNLLSGEIPASLGQLIELKTIYLNVNVLTGSIPVEIGNLIELTDLRLSSNQLTGSIPAEIGNLTKLIILGLGRNNLTGIIPPEIGNLIGLESLTLRNNMLSGEIPVEICNLINLIGIHFAENQLSGEIPACIGNLVQLKDLYLFNNELSGNLSPELCKLINLENITIWGNQLTGCYPECFKIFCEKEDISVSVGDGFDATWEEFCNDGMGSCNCNDRETLIEIITTLSGPDSDLNIDFDLPMSEWEGVSVNEFGCVTHLNFRVKQLSGEISAAIGNLTQLEYLNLEGNNLSGVIPVEIGNLTKLTDLRLSYNQLSGSIPVEIGNLTKLINLALGNNNLTGILPPALGNLIELESISIEANMVSGEIPVEICNCTNLTGIHFGSNELIGEIPACIGNLVQLKNLFLYNNQLSGNLSPDLCKLINLENFKIANKELSGCYPQCFKIFCEKEDINVSVGDGFDATWEDFCISEAGICVDDFVLPGDFNADSCLSFIDVLYWGLAEGNTGPSRSDTSTIWSPKMASNWVANVNGVNGKHQDANGDGEVNQDDLYVFIKNYIPEENRCSQNEVGRTNDFLNYIRIKKVDDQPIEGTTRSQKTYEIYVESKIDNQKVSLHGLELGLTFKGFHKIHSVELDASNFDAKVDTVTSLEGFTYNFAITRTDKGSSIFGIDVPAAILIVTIEDVENSEERTVEEIVSSGSMINPGAGIHPMALQGASTYIVTDNEVEDNDYSVDVVRSPTKGIVEVYVNTNTGVEKFTYQLAPGAEPCESNISVERIDECNDRLTDGCAMDEVVQVECEPGVPPVYNNSFAVHPNPAINYTQLTLKQEHCNNQINKIDIYDVSGYLVQTLQPKQKGDCIYQMEVNDLSTGIYFINMWSGDRMLNGKLMKQ